MSTQDTQFLRVERLLALFKPERYAYLAICGFTCIILVCIAVYLLLSKGVETHLVIGMFGSTGVISFSISRMLKIWNDVIKILFDIDNNPNEKK